MVSGTDEPPSIRHYCHLNVERSQRPLYRCFDHSQTRSILAPMNITGITAVTGGILFVSKRREYTFVRDVFHDRARLLNR